MCGRYGFSIDEQEIRRIVREVEQSGAEVKTGEIFPGNTVPILISPGGNPRLIPAVWGLQNPWRKGLVINARAETASQKPMFRGLLCGQRCLVPSSGFYEWTHDEAHVRCHCRQPGEPLTWMAGLYDRGEGLPRFTILTTAANFSIAPIHDRMPLVIPAREGLNWLNDSMEASFLLGKEPAALSVRVV
ncbi:MAG TPA: SOS response-associated peptidase [Candidatus Merdivicinus intestinigallinarum]|nr:SOS response-associated peptidase [Candidatus Merdivicinus intestinigallinarum]